MRHLSFIPAFLLMSLWPGLLTPSIPQTPLRTPSFSINVPGTVTGTTLRPPALTAPAASPQPVPSLPVAASSLISPDRLTQLVGGNTVAAGGWINRQVLEIRFRIQGAGVPITPQVELRSGAQRLTGQPTASGTTVTLALGQSRTVSVMMTGLQPSSRYRWQARVVDGLGNASPWVVYPLPSGITSAFAVDTRPPFPPAITSTTNPRSGWWYNTHVERFTWRAQDSESGLAGYSVRVDRTTGGNPGTLTQQPSLTLNNLADGRWIVHVWACDRAGNWSEGAIYKLNLDTTPPKITFAGTSAHDFNPYLGPITWRYSVDQWAHVVVDIRRSGQKTPVLVKDLGALKPGTQVYTWDGKSATGQMATADWYWFHVTATDGVRNSSNLAFGGIHVTPVVPIYKKIVISLSQQTIAAYLNGRLVYSSLATTGNFQLSPTPAGHYHIFARYSPYQFVSPWPPGDPLWYESAWSSYAMEFIGGGYFIHDAPWRNVFGPASQAGGSPGTDYGGTHGCVNVPPATAAFLWNWAPVGTEVDVV